MDANNSDPAVLAAEKNQEEACQLNRLPDELILVIFNKLHELKFLCRCSLVSKRFISIILQVNSVSFTVPRRNPNSSADENPDPDDNGNLSKKLLRLLMIGVVSKPLRFLRQIVGPRPVPRSLSSFYGDSFRSAVYFLGKFKEIRSFQLELPSSCHGGDEDSVFKWRAKFGSKLESFVFLSSTSICEKQQYNNANGGGEEEESQSTNDLLKCRVRLAFQCLKDAIVRHRMLLFLVEQHPMLRSIDITDSKKQGRLFVSDGELDELRNWINSASTTLGPQLKSIELPVTASQWYVPVLELPVSGSVMLGATAVLMGMVDRRERASGGSGSAFAGTFEEGEEAFGEAVMEMMLNHKSRMKTLL